MPGTVTNHPDRRGDAYDQQAQRAELEQEAIDVLTRMWLLECRRNSQDPSHAGNQPDEQKRLGGDLVIDQDGPDRGGNLRGYRPPIR